MPVRAQKVQEVPSMPQLLPGDIVVVRTPGFWSWLIRLGEMLQGKPDLRNHVAMVHHEANGVRWYLEGRPSGLGWRAVPAGDDPYLKSRWTVTNAAQPKTGAQRTAAALFMLGLLGAPYDWGAIAADTASALRLPEQWKGWDGVPDGTMPGHVVCSSSASWAYHEATLAAPEPAGGRLSEPADWDACIMTQGWVIAGQAA
jgi:hypothetical protein